MRLDDFRARVKARAVFRTGSPRIKRMVRQQQPNAIRLAYTQALQPLLERMNELTQTRLVPLLPGLVASASLVHDAEAHTGYWEEVSTTVADIGKTLAKQFPVAKLQATAAKFADRTSKHQRLELARQLRGSISIDIEKSEPWLKPRLAAWAHENAQKIKSVPARYLGEIEQRTLQALRTGERAEDIAKEYSARYGVSQSRAAFIARDQIGKLNGRLNIARQKNAGIAQYTWRTSEDERVRETHEAVDGKVFGIDDAPSFGAPGEDYECRCMAEPVVQSEIDALGGEASEEQSEFESIEGGGEGGGGNGGGGGGNNGSEPPWHEEDDPDRPPGVLDGHLESLSRAELDLAKELVAAGNNFTARDFLGARKAIREAKRQGKRVLGPASEERTGEGWISKTPSPKQVRSSMVDFKHTKGTVEFPAHSIYSEVIDSLARGGQAPNIIVDARASNATLADAQEAARLIRRDNKLDPQAGPLHFLMVRFEGNKHKTFRF